MDYILQTNDLTKKYGAKYAANKINLKIPRGKVYGLIGRNGAGKTTILKMLCGLSNPTSGSFTLNGKTGSALKTEMKKTGSLIESPGLYPNMTAFDNLKIKCIAVGKNNNDYIYELLELVGLRHAAKKLTRNFSLGMKQRLGIALALTGDPEFMVLDEPINGLDPQGIVEMRDIISRLSREKGITVIVSSHILEELHKVADCYGIIHDGNLIDELTADELNMRCCEYTSIKCNDYSSVQPLLSQCGITSYTLTEGEGIKIEGTVENPAQLLKLLVTNGIEVTEFVKTQSTLEEYYFKKTGEVKNA